MAESDDPCDEMVTLAQVATYLLKDGLSPKLYDRMCSFIPLSRHEIKLSLYRELFR